MSDTVAILKIVGIILVVVAASLIYLSYRGKLKFWYARNLKTFLGMLVLLPLIVIGFIVASSLFVIMVLAFLLVVFIAWLGFVIFGRKEV